MVKIIEYVLYFMFILSNPSQQPQNKCKVNKENMHFPF